jgi:lipopolysaccharide export system permease protein
MFIISRYILREHIGPFLFSLAIITAMLVLNFVLQAMRYIIGKGISLPVIFEFIIYNLAWIMVLVVPMSMLVSTIMAFGRLSSDNEITALKASGVSFYRLITPVLIMSVIITYGLIEFNDKVLPLANHKARVLKKNIQTKRPTLTIQPGVFMDGIENFSMIIENKDEWGTMIYGITIFDRSNRDVMRTITAIKGNIEIDEIQESMIVYLEQGEIHEVNLRKIQDYQKIKFKSYRVHIPVENLKLKKTDESYYNDREKNISQLMTEVSNRLEEKQRRVESIHKLIEQNPDIVSVLDAKYRSLLENQIIRHSLWDRISDYVMWQHLNDLKDSSNVYKSDQILQTTQHRMHDLITEPGLTIIAKSDSILKIIPLHNDSIRGKLSSIQRDSLKNNLTALTQPIMSNIAAAANYQKMIDQLMIEINKKYSIPAACIIFVLLGAPIGVKARRGNLGIAGGISLFFFIAYYFCLVLGEDYGDRQLLNPFFAMWFPNIILGITGVILTYQTASERTLGIHRLIPAIQDWTLLSVKYIFMRKKRIK